MLPSAAWGWLRRAPGQISTYNKTSVPSLDGNILAGLCSLVSTSIFALLLGTEMISETAAGSWWRSSRPTLAVRFLGMSAVKSPMTQNRHCLSFVYYLMNGGVVRRREDGFEAVNVHGKARRTGVPLLDVA